MTSGQPLVVQPRGMDPIPGMAQAAVGSVPSSRRRAQSRAIESRHAGPAGLAPAPAFARGGCRARGTALGNANSSRACVPRARARSMGLMRTGSGVAWGRPRAARPPPRARAGRAGPRDRTSSTGNAVPDAPAARAHRTPRARSARAATHPWGERLTVGQVEEQRPLRALGHGHRPFGVMQRRGVHNDVRREDGGVRLRGAPLAPCRTAPGLLMASATVGRWWSPWRRRS
jgi:hypothetical protein